MEPQQLNVAMTGRLCNLDSAAILLRCDEILEAMYGNSHAAKTARTPGSKSIGDARRIIRRLGLDASCISRSAKGDLNLKASSAVSFILFKSRETRSEMLYARRPSMFCVSSRFILFQWNKKLRTTQY